MEKDTIRIHADPNIGTMGDNNRIIGVQFNPSHFDKENFTPKWFEEHLEDAVNQAGERYTKKLSVEVSLCRYLHAFGRTLSWKSSCEEKVRVIKYQIENLQRSLESHSNKIMPDFPTSIRKDAGKVLSTIKILCERLSCLPDDPLNADEIVNFRKMLRESLKAGVECEIFLKKDLESCHGKGADTASFRQWRQEYMCDFPASHLDTFRNLIKVLKDMLAWFDSPEVELPRSKTMLIRGPAGVGKTHAIVDHALYRHGEGLMSIVIFGEDFSDGETWAQIIMKLGLGTATKREEFLSALDELGKDSKYPFVIFIDALNETPNRRKWKKWLPVIIGHVERYENLKLCVSCRDTYLWDVLPSNFTTPSVDHNGFEGMEFEACLAFFDYYELERPSLPLMQPEFGNPLFLHLVCQTVRDRGETSLPLRMLGITEVFKQLITVKNEKIAEMIDYDPLEKRAQKAIVVLIKKMVEKNKRTLNWEEAKSLVDEISPATELEKSLFDKLRREGLLSLFYSKTEDESEPVALVRFTFERLADHLIAGHHLESIRSGNDLKKVFQPAGSLFFIVENEETISANKGLLEALAILIPEKYGIELDQLITSVDLQKVVIPLILNSLSWRSKESITHDTSKILKNSLQNKGTFLLGMEAMLSLAVRVGNPLNADFLSKLLESSNMADRDGYWCGFLYKTHGKKKGTDRMIDWALRGDLKGLKTDAQKLWAKTLAWFCAAADRRVRDKSTKALVRLFEADWNVSVAMIRQFAVCDDEYVLERVLCAACGALLRTVDKKALGEIASTVFTCFFKGNFLPHNALIRDYGRLILEMALKANVLPENVEPRDFRPPYQSPPIEWPDKEKIKGYKDLKRFSKLHYKCFEDDFAVKTLKYHIGIKTFDASAWIFMEVINLGYPGRNLLNYDEMMLYKYGGGRAKPVWAERIAKKYQWIALYRLIGRLADHSFRRRCLSDTTEPITSSIQALELRNIDPTLISPTTTDQRPRNWHAGQEYDFESVKNLSDMEWFELKDFVETEKMLEVSDPSDSSKWIVLDIDKNWKSKLTQEDYPYRHINLYYHSYLVHANNAEDIWGRLAERQYMLDIGGENYGFRKGEYDGFIGEYPLDLRFSDTRSDGNILVAGKICGIRVYPTAMTLQSKYEYDSSDEDDYGILAPGPVFFDGGVKLAWDKSSSWKSEDGSIKFVDPSVQGDSAGGQAPGASRGKRIHC